MAGRRPGVPPKAPEERMRTNSDPLVGGDGWTEIDNAPFAGAVPEIPVWVKCSPEARAVYHELAALPQAQLWGAGTWLELHLTLPLIDRYLSRPGSENFKAIISTLGAGLRLTEDDLQRGRVRFKREQDEDGGAEVPAGVANLQERRRRLVKGA